MPEEYDEIGIWSEVKLAIIKEYCAPYATILDSIRRKSAPSLKWTYIDAYAGPGYHLSKTTGEPVEGSPLIAPQCETGILRISLHRHEPKPR